MPLRIEGEALSPSLRDSVAGLASAEPTIVSISDIHGYLEAAQSALLTLADHPTLPPVVVDDVDGTLHWADENYVLLFNGDLIDRGPANEGVLELVARLIAEAPPGRVRVTLGNHEAMALSRDHFRIAQWFAGQVDDADRRALLEAIERGFVVAAYDGYNVTYAHAGSPEPYETTAVNESLIAAADELGHAIGTADDTTVQRRIIGEYPRVLGTGTDGIKGPGSGLVWLHFDHLPADAPPQVVGHTRHDLPTQKGVVYCQNVIRNTLDSPGGEGVVVETPEGLYGLTRAPDGGVSRTVFR